LATRLQVQGYPFSIPARLVMLYWLQNYRRGLLQFNYASCTEYIFHNWKQKFGKSEDHYAQDLHALIHKGYPYAQQGTQEAEKLGEMVLVTKSICCWTS